MIEFSLFQNKTNVTPKRLNVESWSQFTAYLSALSDVPVACKDEAELISPAVYPPGKTRGNANVERVTFIMLDVDDATAFGPQDVAAAFTDTAYALYTTASASLENPRYRLCLPTTRSMMPGEAKVVWRHCVGLAGGVADKACGDPARAYWVPARYPGAPNWVRSQTEGGVIDVDAIMDEEERRVATQPPKPEPPFRVPLFAWKKQPHWTGIYDCPLLKPEKVNEYVNLPRGQGAHYAGLFGVMRSIVTRAELLGYDINATDVARLAEEIDGLAGGTWRSKGYDFHQNALNALKK